MVISDTYAQLVESLWAIWEHTLMHKPDMRKQALKCTTMQSFHIFSQLALYTTQLEATPR